MRVFDIAVKDLVEATYNPRSMTEDEYIQLKKSIQKFGFIDPIIVNQHPERKNIVVGGHQRLKIARDLDMEYVPAVMVNLNENGERELNIRLNKNTGHWDIDKLSTEFEMDYLFDLGFTEKELGLEEPDDTGEGGGGIVKEEKKCPECGYDLTKK